MRFGWLTLSLSPSPEEDADRIDQQFEQVRFAERLGFGDVWLPEHYFTGESVYNDALLFASAVAMRTESDPDRLCRRAAAFHHPVRLAVQLALLDNLSRGRIDVGVGKGTIYNEYEFVGRSKCGQRARASRRATTAAGICRTPATRTVDTPGRSTPRAQPFSHNLDHIPTPPMVLVKTPARRRSQA